MNAKSALLASALALALCGCSDDKPDPARAELDKARAEVVQAKEAADQAKVELELVKHKAEAARLAALAGKPEAKSFLTSPLVGKWVAEVSSYKTIEFFPDGTYRDAALLGSADGRYSVLEGGRVKAEAAALFGGTVSTVWGYAISGDRLVMTMEGGGLELAYKRVK